MLAMVLGTLAEWTQVELEEGVDEGGRTIDPIVWKELESPVNQLIIQKCY